MRKSDISAALTAAGVEHDPASTVAALKALAAEKGVSLSAVPDSPEDAAPSEDGGKPELSPIEEWAAKEVASLTPAAAPKGMGEEAIAEKTRLGMSRKQAIEVLTAQAENDARLAKEEKAKG